MTSSPYYTLQGNLNHSARAQDLLIQSMAERLTHLAVVAEPYRVPSVPDWARDIDSLVVLSCGTSGSIGSSTGLTCVACRSSATPTTRW